MPGCVGVNCSNRGEQGFRLFRFPADTVRRKVWINNMRRADWVPTKSSYLCEKHFEESQFENARVDGWKKLKPNAVPTLFNIPNPPRKITPPPRKSLYKRKKESEKSIGPHVYSKTLKKLKVPKLASENDGDHTYAKSAMIMENKDLELSNNQNIIANWKTCANQVTDPYVLQLELENESLRQELVALREKEACHRSLAAKIVEKDQQLDKLRFLLNAFLNET